MAVVYHEIHDYFSGPSVQEQIQDIVSNHLIDESHVFYFSRDSSLWARTLMELVNKGYCIISDERINGLAFVPENWKLLQLQKQFKGKEKGER